MFLSLVARTLGESSLVSSAASAGISASTTASRARWERFDLFFLNVTAGSAIIDLVDVHDGGGLSVFKWSVPKRKYHVE